MAAPPQQQPPQQQPEGDRSVFQFGVRVSDDRTVFVACIFPAMRNAEALAQTLERAFGKVIGARIMTETVNGVERGKNYAFVTFEDRRCTQTAIRRGSFDINGKKAVISAPKNNSSKNQEPMVLSPVVVEHGHGGPIREPLTPELTQRVFDPNYTAMLGPIFTRQMVPTGLVDPSAVAPEASLTVMSWNVLCQRYVDTFFGYCSEESLSWHLRLPKIVQMLLSSHADILMLQEVGGEEWSALAPYLAYFGYTAAWQNKIVYNPAKGGADGCVIAYSTAKLFAKGPAFAERLRNDAAGISIGMVLGMKANPDANIIVATTHLLGAKLEDDCRASQMKALFEAIQTKVVEPRQLDPAACHVLVGGDLNSEPKWGLVDSVRRGQCGWQFPLGEVYSDRADIAFTDKQFTCFMPHEQDQVDYLFHSSSLVPVALAKVPSSRDVFRQYRRDHQAFTGEATGRMKMEMLPTPSGFPSDHIPLIAQFFVPPPWNGSPTLPPPPSQMMAQPTATMTHSPYGSRRQGSTGSLSGSASPSPPSLVRPVD